MSQTSLGSTHETQEGQRPTCPRGEGTCGPSHNSQSSVFEGRRRPRLSEGRGRRPGCRDRPPPQPTWVWSAQVSRDGEWGQRGEEVCRRESRLRLPAPAGVQDVHVARSAPGCGGEEAHSGHGPSGLGSSLRQESLADERPLQRAHLRGASPSRVHSTPAQPARPSLLRGSAGSSSARERASLAMSS